MTNLLVEIGNRNGDDRRKIVFRYGEQEYPDTFDPYNAWAREQSLKRALGAFGLGVENLPAVAMDVVRLAREKDQETKDNNIIGKPVLIRMDTVEPEKIDWLWKKKIAKGKINLLVGDPGLGKSLVALDWIARVTTGNNWPDGTLNGQPGRAVLLSFEDDAADTIRPRLDAASANVSLVTLLQGVSWYDVEAKTETVRPFDLQRDISALDEAISQECKLLVIDPISACLGSTDSHKNAEVRAALTPLAELAQRRKVAVLGVTHLNKSGGQAMYRTMGSLAFVAAARSVWVVVKDKTNPSMRLVLPVKNNLAPDVEGMSYQVIEVNNSPVLAWGTQPITMSADEALAPEENSKSARANKLRDVTNWLRGLLNSGPLPAQEVFEAGKAVGYSDYLIRSTKNMLKIIPYREGFGRGAVWFWKLPPIDVENALHSPGNNIYAINGEEEF